MKAKEYAEKFLTKKFVSAEVISEEIVSIANEFMTETVDICRARNSSSESCLIAALKEQCNKWKAFARIINKRVGGDVIEPEGFKNYAILRLPELKKHL